MLSLEFDTGEAQVFARQWGRAHPKAAEQAFRAEVFRLKTVSSHRLEQGVGPAKAPLTQEEARLDGSAALAAFARFTAYEVEREGGDLTGTVGFSRWISRQRNPAGRKRTLVHALSGGPHDIDREDQARIARKLRKKMGEPVRRLTIGRGANKRFRVGRRGKAARHPWRDIRIMIPRTGRLLQWPRRDVMAELLQSERSVTPRNLAKLYEIKLAGQRWARRWWTDVPGQVQKAYSRPGARKYFD